jgi:leader peptidase (prepilin peptidase)/N-methyltransferase
LGLCVGSFLNVCLYRWKNGGQVFTPASFCPHCKKTIFWFDNIPVFSYLALRGKCRVCHSAISWQYPLVEISTSFLFLLVVVNFSNDLFLEMSSFVFVSFLVLLIASDLKWRLLPHSFNNLFILTGLFFYKENSGFAWLNFFKTASSFVIIGGLVFGLVHFFPDVLGGGDIKMVLALTIWMGLFKSIYVLILAFGAGSLLALPLLLAKKITRKSTMPFGPFLAFGALVVWFWPEFIDRLRIEL